MHLLFDLFLNLEQLHIQRLNKTEVHSDDIFGVPPSPRTAPKTLRTLSVLNPIGWIDADPSDLVLLPHESIQELNFSFIDSVAQLVEILIAFPHLSCLTTFNLHLVDLDIGYNYTDFSKAVLMFMFSALGPLPNLKSLHLGRAPVEYDHCISQVLTRTPNLREFTTAQAHPLTVAALSAHCPKIQVLSFNTVECSSDSICLLLAQHT
ncbi:hypothetical protein BGZ93_004217 [Podila epicladia]|nr:hypothetical protein BGZ92_011862 [Podila epicladia]KAG0096638.1 hypothetical protein BGZ93_004217 [Podila epicladia]